MKLEPVALAVVGKGRSVVPPHVSPGGWELYWFMSDKELIHDLEVLVLDQLDDSLYQWKGGVYDDPINTRPGAGR